MKGDVLYFATEARFIRSAAGIYAPGSFGDSLWERYLQVFERLVIIARVEDILDYDDDEIRLIKNPNVSFLPIPYYRGPVQYIKVKHRLSYDIANSINPEGAYICRIPGTIGKTVIKYLNKTNHSYACEVVGDPWDVWSGKGPNLLLRPVLRFLGYSSLRTNVSNASAVLYVTNKALQKRYPARRDAFVTSASNVVINDDFCQSGPKLFEKKDKVTILCVGALVQMYKAPDVVLKALKRLRDNGYNVCMKWLGGGHYIEKMKILSKDLGIADYASFVGPAQRHEVISSLEAADFFVMASRTEGMPRALIEAMAMGLPCVGTNIGGIPELLDESVLIPRDDPKALAAKLQELIDNPELTNEQARRNYYEAKKYSERVLQSKRVEFYKYVKDMP